MAEWNRAPGLYAGGGCHTLRAVVGSNPGKGINHKKNLVAESLLIQEVSSLKISHIWKRISVCTTVNDLSKIDLCVKKMKTKWGSCSPVSNSIRLNTELVHKEKEALEFVIVHELIHFIEAKHNEKFYRLLDSALPKWNSIRQKLNEAPLSYATWSRLG